ncbi:MAG: hypothetical protein NTV48_01520, partial [Candidatus Vogelbacteria bacterium]|nr:hypothetical protein [Candidatus Vogelbacteria bacterium]
MIDINAVLGLSVIFSIIIIELLPSATIFWKLIRLFGVHDFFFRDSLKMVFWQGIFGFLIMVILILTGNRFVVASIFTILIVSFVIFYLSLKKYQISLIKLLLIFICFIAVNLGVTYFVFKIEEKKQKPVNDVCKELVPLEDIYLPKIFER